MHGFATPIDAALGIDEGIDGSRRRAAGDTAIGEVEGRLLHVEEAVVAVSGLRDDEGGGGTTFALQQAGIEQHVARRVRLRFAQHLVVARDEAHLGIADGAGGGDRAEAHMQAVLAAHGGEAEVRDDEPLRGDIVVGLGVARGGRGGDHVEPGLVLAQGHVHGNGGGDVLVGGGGGFQRAVPHEAEIAAARLGGGAAQREGRVLPEVRRVHVDLVVAELH